jgi:hypothetical protein
MSAQQSGQGKAGLLPAGVVSLQGRAYSTWAYTLDTAHGMNTAPLVRFLGISTAIVQLPTTENGMVAVVHATVTWRNAEGDTVQFQGIGDANPTNCGPVGKTALLRMAEVRAKGRALRDSVNIGEVLEEEMGGDDAPAAQQQPARAQTPPARRPAPVISEPTGQQQPARAQTNDEAEVSALETQHRRLYNAAQRDQEGKILLLSYLKEQGKTRITEMTMAESTEWLLVFHDREVTPDAAATVEARA